MPSWTQDQVEETLKSKGWYKEQRDIANGVQYRLSDDTPIDWYSTTGRVVVRGRESDLKKAAHQVFQGDPTTPEVSTSISDAKDTSTPGLPSTRVFIVYGHDVVAREQLELLLRRLRLDPLVLQNITGGGDTIIEKLEALTSSDFACVLLTPDDEGCIKGEHEQLKPRARQNAVLEMGMVLAKLGRQRVAILVRGEDVERPSDIDGLIYISFNEHVDEAKNMLAANPQKSRVRYPS